MNRFIGLIPRYLIKNRKRTFIIAFSLVISILLLISVQAVVNALNYRYSKNAAENSGGTYHGFASINTNMDAIKKSNLVESSGQYMKVGTGKYKDKNVLLDIGGYEKSTYDLLSMKLLQGKFPEKSGEISLDEQTKNKLFPQCKLGDSITIEYQPYMVSSGEEKPKNIKNVSCTWRLVGITTTVKNNLISDAGNAAISLEEARSKIVLLQLFLFFRVKDEKNAKSALADLSTSLQKENIKIRENLTYLNSLGYMYAIKNIGAILIIIVTVACAAVIYNIFYITVLERIKEFSVLRAVGASKAGVMLLILGEAVLLTAVCIPFALLAGYGGIKALFYAFISKDSAMLKVLITKMDIIKISIISFISILISALSPAVFGGKINPIEGIKENYVSNIKVNQNTVLKTKSIHKGFKFTTSIAFINIKKSKKRLIATVISLTVSMILAISSIYLLEMFDPQKEAVKYTGGDILLNISNNDGIRENYAYTSKDIGSIEKINNIKSVSKHKRASVGMKINNNSFTESGKSYIEGLGGKFIDNGQYSLGVDIFGMDTSEMEKFKPYLKEGSLNIDNSGVIIVQNLHYKNYTNLKLGEKVTLSNSFINPVSNQWDKIDNVNFTVSAIFNSTPIRPIDGQASVILICNNEALEKYFGIKEYELININVDKKSNIEEVKENLMPIVKSKKDGNIDTINDEIKDMNKINQTARNIFLSFAAILAVVALANIANTISINVAMRKRELGVLRAVGMSKAEIIWMILKEGTIYGIISSIIGSIIGIGVSYIIYMGLRAEFLENAPFEIPWAICAASMAVAVIVTTLVSLPAAKRGVNNSIVESVKAIE